MDAFDTLATLCNLLAGLVVGALAVRRLVGVVKRELVAGKPRKPEVKKARPKPRLSVTTNPLHGNGRPHGAGEAQ